MLSESQVLRLQDALNSILHTGRRGDELAVVAPEDVVDALLRYGMVAFVAFMLVIPARVYSTITCSRRGIKWLRLFACSLVRLFFRGPHILPGMSIISV